MPPRLAAPFLVVFAACSLCDAHADAARLELRAVVQAHASIAAVSAPQQVVLGAADVARGYLDLAQELEVQLRTNVPGGVLLAAAPTIGALRGVALSAAEGEPDVSAEGAAVWVAKQGVGLRVQRVRLRARLLIAPDAATGPIAWPVAFTLTPR